MFKWGTETIMTGCSS